jgi:hypothetical protein
VRKTSQSWSTSPEPPRCPNRRRASAASRYVAPETRSSVRRRG